MAFKVKIEPESHKDIQEGIDWYNKQEQDKIKSQEYFIIYHMIVMIRKELPRVGTRKLYHMLNEQLDEYDIRLGIDRLIKRMGHVDKKEKKSYLDLSFSSLA